MLIVLVCFVEAPPVAKVLLLQGFLLSVAPEEPSTVNDVAVRLDALFVS